MSKSNYQKIVDFHIGADGSIPETPAIPQADILSIRRILIQEEYAEVMNAFDQLDGAAGMVELAHELADLLYVVYGTYAAFGIDADAVYTEVHNANMRKLGGPRREDGKLLKPADWQPADVAGIIERMRRCD
jgi:predicted HAD superfamily Cof-like phosphohydrolase